MNRDTWRAVKRLPWQEAEKYIRAVYDPEIIKTKEYTAKSVFACMFKAIYDRFPDIMTADVLHSIAVDAVEYNDGLLTPEELIEELYQKTGFDIRVRTDEQPQKYIEKWAGA